MIKKVLKISIILLLIFVLIFMSINIFMIKGMEKYIIEKDYDVDTDCVLVLGAYVYPNGNPSDMLRDRLECAYNYYVETKTNRILVSGDHGKKEYDEVHGMKEYLIEKNVREEDVFMDHAGFSTYDSMMRAKEIFGVESLVISTQRYHLYRALYIARKKGLEAYGIVADLHEYPGMSYYKFRESLARVKDFMYVLFNKKPVFLGEEINIKGNGIITED